MTKKILLILMVTGLLFGCIKKNNDGSVTLVGLTKIVAHPSLDLVEQGVVDELESQNIKVRYDKQSANGDMNTAASIANKFKSEKPKVIVAISTPSAISVANAIRDIPIVFAAVSDPISANLVDNLSAGKNNVTGVSDAIPIEEHILEFQKIKPIKRLGLVYTSSESNAVSMAETIKKVCAELGIEFVPAVISNTSEVKSATESIIGRVDAIYVTTDNALVAGLNSLIATAQANKVPVFSADINSSLDGGVLYVAGFNYYKHGRLVGQVVADVLNGKNVKDMKVVTMTDPSDYEILIDLDTAKKLNINVPQELINKARYVIRDGKTTDKR